jgi:hypothetical protein
MLLKKISTLLLATTLILFFAVQTGCKKNDAIKDTSPVLETPTIADDAVKVTATVTGSVIDENNKPVAGAAVTAANASTTTDAMGNFVFKNINISAANGFVTVNKSGYFKGIRSFVTDAGKNNYVKIQLIKQVVSGTVNGANGGSVNTLTGAAITFPAGAFVTANGIAYSGNVIVYAHWIDPTAANLPLVIPGDLRGINSSNGEYLLKSYGMVGAEFTDNGGNALKIAPGKTAAISFPIPTSLQATAPATIPLWHFDEATARWKEEGSATKSGNNYTGQVNKFSFWNVDVPGNFIRLDMLLKNATNNLPLANTLVKITSLTTNISAYDNTNDSGYVSGYVPKNENLKLEVIVGTACANNTVVYSQNIGPYTSNTSLGSISVTLPANQVINFTGSLVNCSNQPVTNGYISLSLANGASTIAYANATGAVNFSVIHCGGTQTYTYNGVDLATGAYSTTAAGSATTATVNLGTVSACGNVINTNGVYIAGYIDKNAVLWKDGVPTFLTNNPPASPFKFAVAVKTVVNNNDVYVLGYEEDSTMANGNVSTVKIWKNGQLTNITSGTTYATALGLAVYNGDVYIAGFEETSTNNIVPKFWKNGVANNLTIDTFSNGEAHNIEVVNGDVYVVGSVTKVFSPNSSVVERPVYWKNGVLNILPSVGPHNVSAYDIAFIGTDIYISGTDLINATTQDTRAVYWKNGIKSNLPITGNHQRSEAYFMCADNNDLYIAGFMTFYDNTQGGQSYTNGLYWKNNNAVPLTNFTNFFNEAYIYDIFVKNNIVYTVGQLGLSGASSSPLFFQNGIAVPLTGLNATQDAAAYGVTVK